MQSIHEAMIDILTPLRSDRGLRMEVNWNFREVDVNFLYNIQQICIEERKDM